MQLSLYNAKKVYFRVTEQEKQFYLVQIADRWIIFVAENSTSIHMRITYKALFAILACLVFSANPLQSQALRSCDSSDGLSSMFVLSVYQDVRGYVWAGTYSGLSILDGNGSTVAFRERPEVLAEAGVMVRQVRGTDNGSVWVNTNFGLDYWNWATGRQEHYAQFTGAYNLAVGPKGHVVVMTTNHGYFTYNAKEHRFHQLTAELVNINDCHAMTIDAEGKWRVITRTHTLEAILETDASGNLTATHARKTSHSMGRIETAKVDGDHLLMVDEEGILYEANADGSHSKPVCQLSAQMRARQPYSGIMRKGNDYLLSFYSGGVFCLRKTANGTYTEETTAIRCGVFEMFRDRMQDIIWVATDGEGLCYLTHEPYELHNELYSKLPFEISKPARAIVRDANNDLWIATKGDGLLCYEDYDSKSQHHNVRQLTTANSALLHNSVYALAEGGHGMVWIGTDGNGINYYDPRTRKIELLDIFPPHFWAAHALMEVPLKGNGTSEESDLFVCTGSNGVFRIHLKWEDGRPHGTGYEQLLYDKDHPARSQFISIARQDSVLWMANREQGIRSYNLNTGRSSIVRLSRSHLSAQNDPIVVLSDTVHRRMICGMSRGLFTFPFAPPRLQAHNIGTSLNLSDATVRGLAMEGDRLWAATTQGLACFDVRTGESNIFTTRDELKVLEFGEGAAYYDPRNGEKFFGGTNGFVVVSAPVHNPVTYNPPILFTGVRIGDRFLYNPSSADGTSAAGPLRLRHHENYLTISYTAVDYLHADRYHFQYRFKNSDSREWQHVGHARSITFADLPPGHYCVQVRYQSGRYVSQPYELSFVIRPPWYATPWAKLLWLLLVAGGIMGAVWLYRWQRARKQRRLQRIAEQQQREAALQEEIRQREQTIQQREGELQLRDEQLEQLRALAAELSPYDVVGERVLHREDQQLLERIFQIITEHVSDPDLSPNMVADELCMSYRTLYRRLQTISDKTLATIIRDIRMEHARQLLTQTKLTIEQVTMQLGYNNRGSFYKHFAAHFGCTPRQFQANYTAEVVPTTAEGVQTADKGTAGPHSDLEAEAD